MHMQGGLNAKRKAAAIVRGDEAMHKLFSEYEESLQGEGWRLHQDPADKAEAK